MPNWPTVTSWPSGVSWPSGTSWPVDVTLASILAGVPLAWMFDAGAAGSGAVPTGSGNTLPTPTQISLAKDQAGSRDFTAINFFSAYSASGGPGGNAYFNNVSGRYMRNVYAAPAPGTTPSAVYLICRPDIWTLNGAIFSASGGLQIAGSSAGKYTMRNGGTASPEIAVANGTWVRAWGQWTDSASDLFRMGASSAAIVASTGNTAGTTNCLLGVDAAYLPCGFAFGFMTVGALSPAQFIALDTLYGARFPGVQF